jgi:signal transduction histidine kinase
MDLELTPAVRHTLEKALAQGEEQLRQGMAQKAGQAERFLQLGHIAARMVHEIRNPLNAIFLHTDILEEEMQQPTADSRTQMAESLGEIRSEVTRLYAVMQDYLALARLVVLDPVSEELGPFLQDCVHEIREQVERRGVTLRLEGLARLGRVSIHPGTMRRAILNVLQFASEAMHAGGTVTLRGRRTATQVSIEVGYTGSHPQETQFDRLFEPFHVVGSAEVGLGLYVVREIVAAHQGIVTVQHGPAAATTFTLTLPLVTRHAREDSVTGQQPVE